MPTRVKNGNEDFSISHPVSGFAWESPTLLEDLLFERLLMAFADAQICISAPA
jgi:hypothetical protein